MAFSCFSVAFSSSRFWLDTGFLHPPWLFRKEVQGTVAYRVKRDCFSRIEVNGFCARYMSRGVPGPKGFYVVWKEGYERCWLRNSDEPFNSNSNEQDN